MIYLKNNTETQDIYIPRQTVLSGGYIATTEKYEEGYNDGFKDGKEQQKDKLSNLNVTENGQYEREDGWNVVNVDVHDLNGSYNEGYEQGKTDGIDEQKAKLESINITENGVYSKEDGYNHIEVNVPDLNGSYEQGQADLAAKARILNVTKNGTYLSKFSEPIVPTTVTGVYADGTNFYSYAELNGKVFNTKIAATINSRLEFWYKGDSNIAIGGWNVIIGSGNFDDTRCFQVRYFAYRNNEIFIEGASRVTIDNWDDTVWHHLIVSKAEGIWIDGEKKGDFSLSDAINGEFFINGIGYDVNVNANGCYGMIKIDDTIIIPTADGFLNTNTGELLEVVKDGSYNFTENVPIYAEGELYKTINVNVPDLNGSYDEGKTDGINEQKSKLESINITKNGTYNREDGWNVVTVDVSIKYNTIADIYGSPSNSTVTFKGLVALSFDYKSGKNILFTDHTGSIILKNCQEPLKVGDECLVTATLRRNTLSYISDLSKASVEVLSSNNYVVMPADAVELTNLDDLYIPNVDGYAEMKYLYADGTVVSTTFRNNFMRIETDATRPDSIALRGDFSDWEGKLVEGNNIRVYMFPENNQKYFWVTDIIKLGAEGGEGGSCNIQNSKWVRPSMADRAENGDIYIRPDEGYDAVGYVDLDPNDIYNEGYNKGLVDATPSTIGGIKFGNSTFEECTFNLEGIEDFSYLFENCKNLRTAPSIQKAIKNARNMFRGCSSLTTAPTYNTSEATDLGGMYAGCHNLTSVGAVDCSSLPNAIIGWNREASIFDTNQYSSLTDFGGFLNLKQTVDLSGLIALSNNSIENIFNNLYDFSGNGETPNEIQGNITMSSFITDAVEQYRTIAESKGWTITIK